MEQRLPRSSLGALLAQASSRWDELVREGLRARGYSEVPPSARVVLLPLLRRGRLRMRDIAEDSGVPKQTISELVHVCASTGLVSCETDPEDHRHRLVSLTEKGRTVGESGLEIEAGISGRGGETLRAALEQVLAIRKPPPAG